MAAILFAAAALLVLGAVAIVLVARGRVAPSPAAALTRSPTQVRTEAAAIVAAARTESLAIREATTEEVAVRSAALEAREAALAERERTWRDRRAIFDERRFAHRKRREEIDARLAEVVAVREEVRRTVAERAAADRETAERLVLENLETELEAERAERVAQLVAEETGEPEAAVRNLLVGAVERQSESHVDTAPRPSPINLEGLDETRRDRLLTALQVVAESTGTDLGVDNEREQATLRGLDPVGREIARQASIEVLDRSVQAADVPPLLLRTRHRLSATIEELGERAMWEMAMEGRPELAELLGVLHYRFSYGQNALLHCKETGYLCGVLAAELGLAQGTAREAGTLHDIGKAVDHDIEGSHAIIGGELLLVLGVDPTVVHAVKAHHFDVEPSTDLAMLTICADAISASRPGARRDTLAAYLARLEQLQGIATRHPQVERAFPLQAGREVRIFVKAGKVADPEMPALTGEIAREIESEMQYPGVIKVTLIRETQAIATAPVQVGRSTEPLEPVLAGATMKRRRRRKKRRGGGEGDAAGPAGETGPADAE